MSKLAKVIEATCLGRVAPPGFNYTTITKTLKEDSQYYSFKLEARIGVSEVVSKVAINASKIEILPHILEDVKRGVVEEIFGEFRPFIQDLRIAAYQQDYDKIQELLRSLETQMFDENQ